MTWKDHRPHATPGTYDGGTTVIWNGDPAVDPTDFTEVPCNGQPQSREESNEEWWYAHCNLYENGEHIGFAAVGYLHERSWQFNTPGFEVAGYCDEIELSTYVIQDELETWNSRFTETRQTIARFDLEGNMLWYRSFMFGDLYGVIQDHQGNIVATGGGKGARPLPDMAQLPLFYNRLGNANDYNIAAEQDCSEVTGMDEKMSLVKVDLDGTLLLNAYYGAEPFYGDARYVFSAGADLAEVQVNGIWSYWVAGRSAQDNDPAAQPFLARISTTGILQASRLYDLTDPLFAGINTATANNSGFEGIESKGVSGSGIVALSGMIRDETDAAPSSAFCMRLDVTAGDPFAPTMILGTDQMPAQHDPAKVQFTTDIAFADLNGIEHIIWPVLSDYLGDIYANQGRAFLKVHLLSGNTPVWTAQLGEVRAYDLKADVLQTTAGDIAVVSTKLATGATYELNYQNLPQEMIDCLNSAQTFDADMTTPGIQQVDWAFVDRFRSYNTDAYVALLQLTNGAVKWETTFDAAPGSERECYPGNFKQQECMYQITEAADGSLVVSGNMGANLDDNYLVKLFPDCQSQGVTYTDLDNFPGAWDQATNTYTAGGFGGTEVWDQDMTLHGTFVVPDGVTLTIENGATIHFADSKLLDHNTRLVVQPGGKLIVRGAAHLTHLNTCPNALWDGILNQGDATASQNEVGAQGEVHISEDATISRARVAVLMASAYPHAYTALDLIKVVSGGWLQANSAHFTDNLRDVVFSPYENHAIGDPTYILPNRSGFTQCTFTTAQPVLEHDGTLASDHVLMAMVRGIEFYGCDFLHSCLFPPYGEGWSLTNGIYAINSTFTVRAYCDVLVPLGTPCPNPLQRSTFTNMRYGIITTTFDLSRTFIVERTDFVRCIRGIRMEGHQDPGITRCTFDVSEIITGDLVGYQYGVYSDQCTGYEIEENAFSSNSHGTAEPVGLVIKDSGPHYNTFYNNSFDGLFTGSIVEGLNADPNTNYTTGLELKCNDYGLVADNNYDVGLTGSDVKIRENQGSPGGGATDPAGNRFSLGHTGAGDPEEDWFVEDAPTTNQVIYNRHTLNGSDRFNPEWRTPFVLDDVDVNVQWDNKETACPTRLSEGGTKEEKRMASQTADDEKQDAETAYDAAKDNGDTYSLLSYVSDATKTSTQVRNALQSIAPKVSEEVWAAAFDRNPAMAQLHTAQALLSNSPLQPEALKLLDNSGLSAYYKQLVWNAQDGTTNILSLLEAAVAYATKEKAEALTDYGRLSWTDKTDLNAALVELETWHTGLPAENNAMAISGAKTAKADHAALESLAVAEEVASTTPELFGVVKRYANAMQANGWDEPAPADKAWIENLAAQPQVIGSAHANAWLNALGQVQPGEHVILPDPTRRPSTFATTHAHTAYEGLQLDAIPNPTNGPVVFVVRGAVTGQQELRLVDVSGRVVQRIPMSTGTATIVELTTSELAVGYYTAEWLLEGLSVATVKFGVQR